MIFQIVEKERNMLDVSRIDEKKIRSTGKEEIFMS